MDLLRRILPYGADNPGQFFYIMTDKLYVNIKQVTHGYTQFTAYELHPRIIHLIIKQLQQQDTLAA